MLAGPVTDFLRNAAGSGDRRHACRASHGVFLRHRHDPVVRGLHAIQLGEHPLGGADQAGENRRLVNAGSPIPAHDGERNPVELVNAADQPIVLPQHLVALRRAAVRGLDNDDGLAVVVYRSTAFGTDARHWQPFRGGVEASICSCDSERHEYEQRPR